MDHSTIPRDYFEGSLPSEYYTDIAKQNQFDILRTNIDRVVLEYLRNTESNYNSFGSKNTTSQKEAKPNTSSGNRKSGKGRNKPKNAHIVTKYPQQFKETSLTVGCQNETRNLVLIPAITAATRDRRYKFRH